jgi:predicted PurR-regulated permease PerM
MSDAQTVRNRLLAVLAIVAAVAALKWSYPVTMPLVVAIFVIAAAWPIKPWLERRLPTSLSYVGTVLALLTCVGFVVLQATISNVIYPMLQGRGMALPPVVIVLALLFWTWVWGIVGALLAVPLTAALVIVCQHFESTGKLARLIAHDE